VLQVKTSNQEISLDKTLEKNLELRDDKNEDKETNIN